MFFTYRIYDGVLSVEHAYTSFLISHVTGASENLLSWMPQICQGEYILTKKHEFSLCCSALLALAGCFCIPYTLGGNTLFFSNSVFQFSYLGYYGF